MQLGERVGVEERTGVVAGGIEGNDGRLVLACPRVDLSAAALRELEEEIGTANVEILAEGQNWFDYDLPDHLVEKLWKGRYRGQRQKWFAMLFRGEDSEINLATEHPEFSTWRWAELDEVPDAIVPFKRGLYDGIVAEFRPVVERVRLGWRHPAAQPAAAG